jgi:antitoxin ParD1/3/4
MATSSTIGAHYERFIKELIESGRYSTASEVMRDALRLVEEREDSRKAKLEALHHEIQIGLNSGPAEALDIDDIIAEGRRIKAAADNAR